MKRSAILVLSTVLSATMLLAGCTGNSNSNSNESASPSSTAGAAPSDSASVAPAGLPEKYDPPIELTTFGYRFADKLYKPGEDLNNNAWKNYLRDKYGIKVTHVWEVPYVQYPEKTNLAIAGGELPDYFAVSAQQYKDLIAAGEIEDLTEVYEKYAPEVVKQVVTESGPEALESAKVDGKLMGIPFTGVSKENTAILWVRMDWLKKLNLPEPKTMNDLFTIAEAFANKDPDGDNKKDTVGLGLSNQLAMPNTGFFNGYHAYKNIWVGNASGQLEFGSIQPAMQTALAKLHEMYKNGSLDKEFGVKDALKLTEDYVAGKVGMFYGIGTEAVSLQGTKDKDPNADWKAFPIPSIDNEPAKVQHEMGIFDPAYWVVKKGVKHPEAILRLAEQWLNIFYFNKDVEVKNKFVSDDDKYLAIWTDSPMIIYRGLANVEIAKNINKVLNKEADASSLTPNESGVYDLIEKYKAGDNKSWDRWAIYGTGGSMSVVDYYSQNNLFMGNKFTTTWTPTMLERKANLDKLELETFTKIVVGKTPVEDFSKFVDQWKKLGGDEITKEVNDWYATTKK